MWLTLKRISRAEWLLLLGLFLLWNWGLFSVTSHNHPYLMGGDVLQLFAWKTVAFAALFLGLFAITRRVQPTLIGLSFFVILWLFGGALVSAVASGAYLQAAIYIALIIGLRFVAGYVIKTYPEPAGLLVALYGAFLCCLQLPGVFAALTTQTVQEPLSGLEAGLSNEPSKPLPHIIYIMPDRYASNAVLRSQYDFSNEDFTSKLEEFGFHIWDDQYSNYPKTFQSLASSLNSDYLDPALDSVDPSERSYSYITPLIKDFAAQRALQAQGYSYKHIGAWWEPTRENEWADESFKDVTLPFDEITSAYFQVTPLKLLIGRAQQRKTPCEIAEEKISFIREQIQSETPQFILWHTLMTHAPYIYDDDGTCRGLDEERLFITHYDERKAEYIKHIGHFNAVMIDLIEAVMRDSDREVIFVIQSDEGPFPKELVRAVHGANQPPYNFWEASQDEKRQKHGVFNAIYLPSQSYEGAQDLRSPVNNFRLIFRELTGQDVPLLPDRFYSFEFEHHPYDLKEISDELIAK